MSSADRVKLTDAQGGPLTIRATATEAEKKRFLESVDAYVKEVMRYGNEWCVIKAAKEVDPQSCMALVLNADFELASENFPAALANLEEARKHVSGANDRERLYVEAWTQWLTGDDDALDTFEKLRDAYPTDLLVLKRAGLVAFLRHDFPRLLRVSEDKTGALQNAPYYHGIYAFALEQNGYCKEAEEACERALEMDPTDAWAQHGMAHVLLAQGRYSEGITWLGRHTEHWDGLMSFLYTHNWWHLGLFYLESGDFKTAERIFDERLFPRLAPGTPLPASPPTSPRGGTAYELFPKNNRKNAEDQMGAMGYLAKWELRLRLAAAATSTAPRPAKIDALTDRWKDVLSTIQVPTPHFSPLFDILLIHGLCRVGRDADVSKMLSSLAEAAAAPSAPSEMAEIILPVARTVAALGRGDPYEAYKLFRPHVTHMFDDSPAVQKERAQRAEAKRDGAAPEVPLPLSLSANPLLALGGSHEQREIADEFFLDACFAMAEAEPDPEAEVPIPRAHRVKALFDIIDAVREKLPLRVHAPHWHGLLARGLALLAQREDAIATELRANAAGGL